MKPFQGLARGSCDDYKANIIADVDKMQGIVCLHVIPRYLPILSCANLDYLVSRPRIQD